MQARRRSPLATATRTAILLYQRMLSPFLPMACRFSPTCSAYALQAIDGHGALRGTLLAAWRVLRCNKLSNKVFDPIR